MMYDREGLPDQEAPCALELLLVPEQGDQTQVTEELVATEVKKLAKVVNIILLDSNPGEPVKFYVEFSDAPTTNSVKERLDKSYLGDTKIKVVAMFPQNGSSKDSEEESEIEHLNFKKPGSLLSDIAVDDMRLEVPHLSRAIGTNKWVSEDPNILGKNISDLKDELMKKEKQDSRKTKASALTAHKLRGDEKLIDGPDDYALRKLTREGNAFVTTNKFLSVPQIQVIPQTQQQPQYQPQTYPHHNQFPPQPQPAYYNSGYYQSDQYNDGQSFQNHRMHHPPSVASNGRNQNPYYAQSHAPPRYHPSDQMSWQSQEYPTHQSAYNQPAYYPYQSPTPYHANQAYYPTYQNSPNYHTYNKASPESNSHYSSDQSHSYSIKPKQPSYFQQQTQFSSKSHSDKNKKFVQKNMDEGQSEHESSNEEHYEDNEDSKYSPSGQSSGNSKTKNQLKRFKQLIEAKSSNILHVKGLDSEEITADLINSLFSNFGNIQRMLFIKHKHAAFIVYEDQDLATIAKEMLSNLRFMDCHLKITFSNDQTFEKILSKENQNQLLIPNPKLHRFKDKKISINPPSKTLHVSNIPREIYTDAEISDIFGEVAQVKRVK